FDGSRWPESEMVDCGKSLPLRSTFHDTHTRNMDSRDCRDCGGGGPDSWFELDLKHWADRGRTGPKTTRRQVARRQPSGVPRGGRVPGGSPDAWPSLQANPDFRGDEAPLGPGTGRTNRCRDRSSRTAASHRSKVGRVQGGVW